jgi:hypothetical protein
MKRVQARHRTVRNGGRVMWYWLVDRVSQVLVVRSIYHWGSYSGLKLKK